MCTVWMRTTPAKTVAAIKGMIPYRPGATSVDPAAPAFVPARRRTRRGSTSSRFVPPPAAQARGGRLRRKTPTWRGRWRRRADMQRAARPADAGPRARSCRVGRREPRAELRAVDGRPRRRRRRRRLRPQESAGRCRRDAAGRVLLPPPPPAPATSYCAAAARRPARRGRGVAARDGDLAATSPTSSQREISRDVAQAVERADLGGCCRSPTSRSTLARVRARRARHSMARRSSARRRTRRVLNCASCVRLICLIRDNRLCWAPTRDRGRRGRRRRVVGGGGSWPACPGRIVVLTSVAASAPLADRDVLHHPLRQLASSRAASPRAPRPRAVAAPLERVPVPSTFPRRRSVGRVVLPGRLGPLPSHVGLDRADHLRCWHGPVLRHGPADCGGGAGAGAGASAGGVSSMPTCIGTTEIRKVNLHGVLASVVACKFVVRHLHEGGGLSFYGCVE